jgi:hypothetical protein
MKDYEQILSKIPYSVIEQHLKRRKEENSDSLKWSACPGWYEVDGVRKVEFPDEL